MGPFEELKAEHDDILLMVRILYSVGNTASMGIAVPSAI
jgi:hypothetical protein